MPGKELNTEVCEVVDKIEEGSSYKRKQSEERKMMTVHEMGDLLGLKKTDRYWLVHKNFFKTKVILGKIWVDIVSFEKWYANQVKYHKVNGEEPGKDLKSWSYSPKELAQELGVTDSVLYDILKRENIETVTVDYWKRIPKEAFDKWYVSQSRYRTRADREKDLAAEAATITMPEMARLLGVKRNTVYAILKSSNYKDFFEIVVIAGKKRITKDSFQRFLDGQDRYHLVSYNDYAEVLLEENIELADFRRRKLFKSGVRKGNGNKDSLTKAEAAMLAKVSKSTIDYWAGKGHYTIIKVGELVRIPRDEFEDWLGYREKMEV